MTVRNDVEGSTVHGTVVQAGSIQNLTVSPADREYRAMQLPAPPHAFVDRVDVLRSLDRALAEHEQGPALFVLTGMAGVGKSAAAAHWAHVNQHRFDGGALYADLDDHRNQRGVGISDVVAMFLRGLGVHNSYIPATTAERIALFRSRTATKRFLVLLDGVDEPAQARSVVPSASGSVVVVTSRQRLAGLTIDGAEFIDLSPLGTTDSADLMAGMIPASRINADRTAFEHLVQLCAGLPLALRVAGARLTHHRRWSVARFVQHLSDGHERLNRLAFEGAGGSVAQMFDTAYAELPQDVRRLYRCLGLHTGPHFSPALAAVAADVPDPDELLNELCTANLLVEVGEDRFRFHQLIALHARKRAEIELSGEERAEVVRRIVDWFARGAAAADAAVLAGRWRLSEPDLSAWPVRFDSAAAMTWFSAERPNLLAVMRTAAEFGWHDVVWRMCDSLWSYYHSSKQYADWIDAHRLGIGAAQLNERPLVEAHLRNRLARAHIEMRDFATAAEQLDEAAALPSDDRVVAVLMESRGLLYREQHRYPEAADVFRALVAKQREAGDDRAFVLQSYQLGDVLVRAEHADQAVPVLTAALRTMERLRNEELVEARVRIVLGAAYCRLQKYDDAREELECAVEVTHARKQPVKEAQALEELVGVAQAASDGVLFESATRRLARLYEAVGNPRSAEVHRWIDAGHRHEDA
jgi:tetratricopeptide (TPR) repeat protein